MKPPMIASSSSRCCTRASLVAKRGSVFSSGRPMVSRMRIAIDCIEPDIATKPPSLHA